MVFYLDFDMRILFFVLCIILTSCSANFDFKKDEFEQKKKGVVFFTVKDQDLRQNFILRKLASDKSVYENGYDYYSNKYKIMCLEPGIYYLDTIYLSSSSYNIIRSYPSPGLKNDKLLFGGFEVKGGEILAIGVLNINSYTQQFDFYEDFQNIKRDLEKSPYPELASKLKRGKFFMRGSTVAFKDQKFVLLDKEKSEKDSLIKKLCKEGKVNENFCR
ncbi:MAG: hypothetical protein ACI8ZF_000360 [Candidatus Midichloriaceae bacterium]